MLLLSPKTFRAPAYTTRAELESGGRAARSLASRVPSTPDSRSHSATVLSFVPSLPDASQAQIIDRWRPLDRGRSGSRDQGLPGSWRGRAGASAL